MQMKRKKAEKIQPDEKDTTKKKAEMFKGCHKTIIQKKWRF